MFGPKLISCLFLISLSISCGPSFYNGSSDTGTRNTGGGGGTGTGSTKFACGDFECQQGTEYCINSLQNDRSNGSRCASLGATCNECDCAEENSKTDWPTACRNANGYSCEARTGKITINCLRYASF